MDMITFIVFGHESSTQNTLHKMPIPKTSTSLSTQRLELLHLVDNLLRLGQALYHLLAVLTSPDCVLGLLEELVELIGLVHVGKEFTLHVLS
jgi:hypothetical protein